MKYFRNTLDFKIREPSAIALGKFDGLHRGHKYLLREINKGTEFGCRSVAFTFDIPPRSLGEENVKVLLTNSEKEQIFSSIGIDYVVECPFTEELKRMRPYDFLKFLTERINLSQIVAGTDFRFGRNRDGSCLDLLKYEKTFGYHTIIVNKVQYEGEDISSTRIRDCLVRGDLDQANFLLGYPCFISAPVLHGNGIGERIGVPTVNQLPEENKLLPPNGVYASRISAEGRSWYGVSDIGYKPTVGEGSRYGVETHLFDFNGSLYDREISVSFLKFIRDEEHFGSMDELCAQIKDDCEKARKICEMHALHKT